MTAALVAPPPARAARLARPALLAAAVVIGLGVAARLVGFLTPLWFDETFSAVIASQPTFAQALAWCRAEIGGPGYYLLLWLWAQAVGTGAVALRSLSLVASLAAPALIAWRGHPDRATRLSWAALLLLWLPAIDHGSNARCYALATLAATGQAIAFLRLMAAPSRARALAWTGASAALILIHAYGAVVAVVGGLLFLWRHRGRAVRCWPALVALAPVAGWMAWQYPVLARFAGQGQAFKPFGLVDLLFAPSELFDSPGVGLVLVLLPLLTWAKGWRGEAAPEDRALAWTGPGAIAVLLVLALATSAFAWRYVVPAGPALMFALAIWARGLRRHYPPAPALLLALFAAGALARGVGGLAERGQGFRDLFTLQRPSEWFAAHDAHHLAFQWDGPTGAMSDRARMAEVAGYFLRQGGRAERVTVVGAAAARPTAPVVAATLRADPTIDSLLWIADPSMPGVLAAPDRRMMAGLGWTCRDFGRAPLHLLACRKV